MYNESLENLTNFLCTDPEIVDLKKRYHEATGRYLPGWNWHEYRDLDDYISYLHGMVDEAELNAERNKS